jgi:uncharacterized protein YecE (DUF72 family)
LAADLAERGPIRIGVGGWVFEPWRGSFYPQGLPQKDELAYMARRLTAIEINSTYYGAQKPETFRKWAAATPDGFKFAVKGNRFCTNRRELAGAGAAIEKFFAQGVTELGERLGPVLWQFAPTKIFDAGDFEAFLELLPGQADGLELRHVVEVRHDSFRSPVFLEMLRRFGVGVVHAEHAQYPGIWDVCGDVVYLRLQTGSDEVPTAYPPRVLDGWADRLKAWAEGEAPRDLELVAPDQKVNGRPREVFAFVIHEGKIRAPAAALALIERVAKG